MLANSPVGQTSPFSFEMDGTPTENMMGIFKVLSLKGASTLYIKHQNVLNSSMGGSGILYVAIMKNIPTSLAEMQADATYQSYDSGYSTAEVTYTIPESVKDGDSYYVIICANRVYWLNGGTYYPYRGRYLNNAYLY